VDFRKEFLFRDEFIKDDVSETFLSTVTSVKAFSVATLWRQRMNRFQTVDEALPQVTLSTRDVQIGETNAFVQGQLDVASFQTKRAHSDNDSDVVRVDWFQQLRYALSWFRPIEVTPRAGMRQTYYTKDIQGGAERPDGKRDVVSGRFETGVDASLKLYRIFAVATDALGLDISLLRHVLTPTVSYGYAHQPTVPGSILNFAAASGTSNQMTFGVENKLQTKRRINKKLRSVDLARWLISLPYTFRGHSNKQGGRLGDWSFDLELYPWSWMRLETDWIVPSHFLAGTRDRRITTWNTDLVIVGGGTGEPPSAAAARDIQAPVVQTFQPGARGGIKRFLPYGEWYLGLGHRYSQNDKTQTVMQFDWGLSEKWEIGTFHRFTWKEVAGGAKRFGNVREWQYSLRRDLHDWVAELVYRVDREFGEELFFTLTLKAYPDFPIEIEDSYHQPKLGSQNSPFSPVGPAP
jgi:hypothetical protein